MLNSLATLPSLRAAKLGVNLRQLLCHPADLATHAQWSRYSGDCVLPKSRRHDRNTSLRSWLYNWLFCCDIEDTLSSAKSSEMELSSFRTSVSFTFAALSSKGEPQQFAGVPSCI